MREVLKNVSKLFKEERGITLVALVITVIVLLILSGVSISLVVGNNGVLTQASNAVVENRKASAREDVEMAFASAEADFWVEWTQNSSMQKDLVYYKEKYHEYLGVDEDDVTKNDDGTYKVKYIKDEVEYTFIVDQSGNVSIYSEWIQNSVAGFGSVNDVYKSYFGKKVSGYGSISGNNWRLFYADRNYAYLIADSIGNKALNNSSMLGFGVDMIGDDFDLGKNLNPKYTVVGDWYLKTNETDINNNIKGVAALLDTNQWGDYKSSDAEWAIGAPTLEMFIASYNATHTDAMHTEDNDVISQQLDCKVESSTATGYKVGFQNGVIADFVSQLGKSSDIDKAIYCNDSYNWWLASPSASSSNSVAIVSISYNGYLSSSFYNFSNCVRPLVAVPLSKIGKNGDNKTITITDNY